MDLGLLFEFTETFKKELIGACKDVKAAKDAASERIIAPSEVSSGHENTPGP